MHGVILVKHLRALMERSTTGRNRHVTLRQEEVEELRRRKHADEESVASTDRERGLTARLQHAKRINQRRIGLDQRDLMIHEVADTHVDVTLHARRRKTVMVEHPLRLGRQPARANRLDISHTRPSAKVSQRIGAHDRIGVRVPVSTNIRLHVRYYTKSSHHTNSHPQRPGVILEC